MQRHIVPPRRSVELGERLGMFDDTNGDLETDATNWQDIADRDAGELRQEIIDVAGTSGSVPLEDTGGAFERLVAGEGGVKVLVSPAR